MSMERPVPSLPAAAFGAYQDIIWRAVREEEGGKGDRNEAFGAYQDSIWRAAQTAVVCVSACERACCVGCVVWVVLCACARAGRVACGVTGREGERQGPWGHVRDKRIAQRGERQW